MQILKQGRTWIPIVKANICLVKERLQQAELLVFVKLGGVFHKENVITQTVYFPMKLIITVRMKRPTKPPLRPAVSFTFCGLFPCGWYLLTTAVPQAVRLLLRLNKFRYRCRSVELTAEITCLQKSGDSCSLPRAERDCIQYNAISILFVCLFLFAKIRRKSLNFNGNVPDKCWCRKMSKIYFFLSINVLDLLSMRVPHDRWSRHTDTK